MAWWEKLLGRHEPVAAGRPLSEWVAFARQSSVRKGATPGMAQETLAALVSMGPDAAPALPELLGWLAEDDGQFHGELAAALVAIGAESVEPLTSLATSPRSEMRQAAIWALGRLSDRFPAALPPIFESFRDPDPSVRDSAVGACQHLGVAILPRLLEAMGHPDPVVVETASEAVAALGAVTVPALAESLRTGDRTERLHAARILAFHGADAKSALPQLLAALSDSDPAVREMAAIACGAMGSAAVVGLISMLRTRSSRRGAALALARIGPDAKTALPALVSECLADEDAVVRRAAAETLGLIGPDSKPAVLPLRKLVVDPVQEVRLAAARAFGRIGRKAEAAVPVLTEGLKARDAPLRAELAKSLGLIGPAAATAFPALVAALRDPAAEVRLAAVGATQRLAPAPDVLTAPFIERLGDPDERIRSAVARSLLDNGVDPAHIPALEQLAASSATAKMLLDTLGRARLVSFG